MTDTTTLKNINHLVPGTGVAHAASAVEYKQDNLNKERARKLDPRVAAARARAEQIAKAAEPVKDIVPTVTEEEEQEYNKLHPLSEQLDKPTINPENLNNVNIKLNKVQEQALKLLGQGLKPSLVAQVLSVDPSRISQLMEDPVFARMVTERKIVSLTKATERDEQLDSLEDKLIAKMHTAIDMTYKPSEIVRMFNVVNQAKRRGVSADSEGMESPNVTTVKLILPAAARAKMQVNVEVNEQNQVISVGTGDTSQQLGAINPKHLMDIYKDAKVIEGRVVKGNAEEIEDAVFTEQNAANLQKITQRAKKQEVKLDNLDGTDASNINLDEL